MSIDELKENIVEKCTGYYDLGALSKLATKPEVYETCEMVIPDKELNYQGGVALGPFVQYQLFILSLIVLPFAILLNFFTVKIVKSGLSFLLTYILLYFIGYIIYKNIKYLHREIKIDRNGIILNEGEFQWNDIYRTFILNAKGYRGANTTFLVIVDKNMNIVKHEITFLSCPKELLATIIEYYKAKREIH